MARHFCETLLHRGMSSPPPTRRARLRAQTLAEIKERALAQVGERGPAALSLNAIARDMGMSGPALYRYFGSRDELLAVLVTDAWSDLAGALEQAAVQARRRSGPGRVRAVADAYRGWALAHPQRYRLALSTTYGSGALDPDNVIPAAHRGMLVLLEAIEGLGPLPAVRPGAIRALDRQIRAWRAARPGTRQLPAPALELGVLTWTRLHGLVSLELEGVFASMDLDAALLFRAEVEHLLAQHDALARRGAYAPAAAHPAAAGGG